MDLTLLRVERVRKGYTQEQLANILGFKNKSSYCLIENGKATVSIELANRIAIALGLSEDITYRIFFADKVQDSSTNQTEQQNDIKIVKERRITVKMSDSDCDRLARKCGKSGITIGELIQSFIGDLIDGTYSNGSDERDYADKWFERCWFGMFPEPTLLNHLLNNGWQRGGVSV